VSGEVAEEGKTAVTPDVMSGEPDFPEPTKVATDLVEEVNSRSYVEGILVEESKGEDR
jgi:hypothetical protein